MNHIEIPVADGIVDFIVYIIPILIVIFVFGFIAEAISPHSTK